MVVFDGSFEAMYTENAGVFECGDKHSKTQALLVSCRWI